MYCKLIFIYNIWTKMINVYCIFTTIQHIFYSFNLLHTHTYIHTYEIRFGLPMTDDEPIVSKLTFSFGLVICTLRTFQVRKYWNSIWLKILELYSKVYFGVISFKAKERKLKKAIETWLQNTWGYWMTWSDNNFIWRRPEWGYGHQGERERSVYMNASWHLIIFNNTNVIIEYKHI